MISSGNHFVLAVNTEKEVYQWGRGEWGVFGDGNSKSLNLPKLNDNLKRMRDDENLKIVKLKSNANWTLSLMSDGNLYGWGSNDSGHLGIRSDLGIEMYETTNFPTPMINEDFKNAKIKDYAIGENISIVLLDNNEVYWSGLRLAYKPERLKLPEGKKLKKVAAAHRSAVAVTEDNELYMKAKFVKHNTEDLSTGVLFADSSIFFGGDVVDIGGSYKNRFAIIKH
eukprot:TRINITY_DN6095_c0_g1_i3.p2 TRINITY_DN6095_c0_g1~~TRINITY_DN6095_c0_g1_i3.p2  ORF type:complete len:225 (+),score=68.31 TRINITY_DN6095_c0_g1_i3:756-1430(+)